MYDAQLSIYFFRCMKYLDSTSIPFQESVCLQSRGGVETSTVTIALHIVLSLNLILIYLFFASFLSY